MKKSLVAVSIIVVLGAAWTGASWYTGKQIESHLDEAVATLNSQLNGQLQQYIPKSDVVVSYENLQRGVFSSQVRVIVRAKDAGKDAETKANNEISFQETIYHGPFPLAQLKRGNLLPSLAVVHTELEKNEVTKQLFEIAQEKSPFNAETRIGYNRDSDSVVNLVPMSFNKDRKDLKFSGATANISLSDNNRRIKFSANSDSTEFTIDDNLAQKETYVLEGFSMVADTDKAKFDLPIGNQTLTVKNVKAVIDGKETFLLQGLNINSQSELVNDNVKGKADYSVDSVKVQGQDFGSSKLSVTVDNLDAQALKTFAEDYDKTIGKNSTFDITSDRYQEQVAVLAANLPTLLKNSPVINISPLSWKNSKGESSFNLQLALRPVDPKVAETLPPDERALQSIAKLDAKLNIPTAMAVETTRQVAVLQGNKAEEAQKLAEEQVQGLAAMGQMFKIATVKDDAISSSFSYSDNKVDLNGQKMTLQEFGAMFGMFGGSHAAEPEADEVPSEEAPADGPADAAAAPAAPATAH